MINIIEGPYTILDEDGTPMSQYVTIEISDGVDTYQLRVGNIPIGETPLLWLQERESELFAQAEARGEQVNILESAREREVLRAFAEVLLDEINLLREAIVTIHPAAEGQLPQRTLAQLKQAIINKLTL